MDYSLVRDVNNLQNRELAEQKQYTVFLLLFLGCWRIEMKYTWRMYNIWLILWINEGSANITDLSLTHSQNALYPISVTDLGIIMDWSEQQ